MHTPDRPPPHPSARLWSWRYWLVICLLLGLVWLLGNRSRERVNNPQATPRAVAPRGNLGEQEKAIIALFRQAAPAVVFITTLARQRDIFSLNLSEIPQGTGSGFIWNQEGHIITNFHVLQGASGAKVTMADQSVWDAQLVGVDPDHDIAVLYINAPKDRLRPIALGSSSDLEVGQHVFAIGNPFGLDHTLTTGIISALGREITSVTNRTIQGVIQTDAAINPGNSGGPLLDSAGRLIGVNTAIYSPSGSSAGIGFAVPVDTVNRVVPHLIRYGKVIRPGLGVHVSDDNTIRRLGLPGVLILQVDQGSTAETAGLRGTRRDAQGDLLLGDIMIAVEADTVKTSDDLLNALDKFNVGDTVKITVVRGNTRMTVPVVLQAVR